MSKPAQIEHRDVIIIGAGVSGLGAAVHLQRDCPQKDYLILEARENIGGTWDLFRFPGIRSDSDLFTYGYDFKPWHGPPIATAGQILEYLHEVVDEYQLEQHIRFQQRVTRAQWSSESVTWTIEATNAEGESCRFSSNFLIMCQGYYDHAAGYRPGFPHEEAFKGNIIHPQQWPENLDYDNKQMVVIGSGATAATIVPAVADRTAHVTQLQRSPTYYIPAPMEDDDMIKQLRELDVPREWIHGIRLRQALAGGKDLNYRALNEPEVVRQELLAMVAEFLPENYDLNPNFTPRYDPWKERICILPDGDLLQAVASGKASIVTDTIERFTEDGILLTSGKHLPADIIVTATGIELSALGNIQFTVDGKTVNFADTWTYHGIMISGLPNLAWIFGYIRSSWTLRSDLIARYLCRLFNHMDAINARRVTPCLRPQDENMQAKHFIDPDDFAPGYMKRGTHRLPKQGSHSPWLNIQDYYIEKDTLPQEDFTDGALQFK